MPLLADATYVPSIWRHLSGEVWVGRFLSRMSNVRERSARINSLSPAFLLLISQPGPCAQCSARNEQIWAKQELLWKTSCLTYSLGVAQFCVFTTTPKEVLGKSSSQPHGTLGLLPLVSCLELDKAMAIITKKRWKIIFVWFIFFDLFLNNFILRKGYIMTTKILFKKVYFWIKIFAGLYRLMYSTLKNHSWV